MSMGISSGCCWVGRRFRCHCERSEAIIVEAERSESHPCPRTGDGWVRFAHPSYADTTSRSRGALRPRFASSLALLENQRAQGRPGACCTRGLACDLRKQNCTRAYRAAGAFRPSLRNGFTAYFVLSPENGSFASVAPEKLASRELNASTAAPGPHDFAVRFRRARLVAPSASTASHRTFVTIANAPHLP